MTESFYRPPVVVTAKRRPTYVQPQDKERERKLCVRINESTPFKATQVTKNFSPYDIVLQLNGNVKAIIEFKHRPNALTYIRGVMLSREKAIALTAGYSLDNIPAFFCVETKDGEYHMAQLKSTYNYVTIIGGPLGRNDEADTELVILIPLQDFYPLSDFMRSFHEAIDNGKMLSDR